LKYFSVKNFDKFQHYKERNPPWIKLHNSIFTDYYFSCLQDASKLHLLLIWALASKLGNKIPFDEKWLKQQLNLKSNVNVKPLFDKGFLVMLDDCKQDASKLHTNAIPETETLSGEPDPPQDEVDCKYIVAYLNRQAHRNFSVTPKYRELVRARSREGFVLDDFKRVVDNMVAKWGKDVKMVEYLRPFTLFSNKFDSYLNARPPGQAPPEETQEQKEAKTKRVNQSFQDDLRRLEAQNGKK